VDLAAGDADERIPLVDGKTKDNISKHAQIRGIISSVRKYCCSSSCCGDARWAAVGVIGILIFQKTTTTIL
jgi:hypothetical protein